jgi:TonB-dependent starch-binding outer membrane protein SusC
VIELPYGITVSARGEYQGGHYITDGASENAQSRNIASWPTCLGARRLIAEGKQSQLTAYERQFCIAANFVSSTSIYPADFFKLRDLSLLLPLPAKLVRAQRANLTLTARNWYRWLNSDFPIFDPEMMDNEGALGKVRAFNEQYPVPATFIGSIRLVF